MIKLHDTSEEGEVCHSYEFQNPHAMTSFGEFYDRYILRHPVRPGEEMTMFTCHEVPVRAVDAYYRHKMDAFDKLPRTERDRQNYSARKAL